MTFVAIPDAEIAAYQPVKARLLRKFRDAGRGVRVQPLPGPQTTAWKSATFTDGGDEGTWKTADFGLRLRPWLVHPTLGVRLVLRAMVEIVPSLNVTTTTAKWRIGAGSPRVYSNELEATFPGGFPDVYQSTGLFTLTWVPTTSDGLETLEVGLYATLSSSPVGQVSTVRFRWSLYDAETRILQP